MPLLTKKKKKNEEKNFLGQTGIHLCYFYGMCVYVYVSEHDSAMMVHAIELKFDMNYQNNPIGFEGYKFYILFCRSPKNIILHYCLCSQIIENVLLSKH